ncbi:hypothetical protein SAMN05720762_11422 [Fibrobacter sp. UWH4]|nr:hypothetical protein SAMN05720762_11422 [Fibrobacter sp. UWH4]
MSTLVYTRFEVGRLRRPLGITIVPTAPYLNFTPHYLTTP